MKVPYYTYVFSLFSKLFSETIGSNQSTTFRGNLSDLNSKANSSNSSSVFEVILGRTSFAKTTETTNDDFRHNSVKKNNNNSLLSLLTIKIVNNCPPETGRPKYLLPLRYTCY